MGAVLVRLGSCRISLWSRTACIGPVRLAGAAAGHTLGLPLECHLGAFTRAVRWAGSSTSICAMMVPHCCCVFTCEHQNPAFALRTSQQFAAKIDSIRERERQREKEERDGGRERGREEEGERERDSVCVCVCGKHR